MELSEKAGSPDLDLAMAVEMSQLYTDKKEVPTYQEEEEGNMTTEEKELHLAIKLSLREVQQKTRQSRFAAKSVSQQILR